MKRSKWLNIKKEPKKKFKSPLADMKSPAERKEYMETIFAARQAGLISQKSALQLMGLSNEEV